MNFDVRNFSQSKMKVMKPAYVISTLILTNFFSYDLIKYEK